ncbi:MAG: site-specific integrase [Brevibacterium sp.]|nr:site-specific integrase [Brevibacterium sp.]
MVQRRPRTGKPKNGKPVAWVARWYGPDGETKSLSFHSRKDAKLHEDKMKADVAKGVYVNPQDLETTIKELAEQWMEQAVARGTRSNRKSLIDNLGALANVPIGGLRKSHVTSWIATLRRGRPWADNQPYADSTISLRVGQLSTVVQQAVDDDLIVKNPVKLARKGMANKLKSVQERQVPTPVQINMLIDAARRGGVATYTVNGVEKEDRLPPSEWLARCIILASETGLRIGEVAGLEGHDIDFDRMRIHVARQCPHKVGVDGPLKNASSDRYVPISRELARDLKRWMREPQDRVIAGARGDGVSSPVISASMTAARRVAGIEAPISMHGMRHAYATALLGGGQPLHAVSALLGHDEIATTDRIYSHFLPGHLEGSRAAIGALAGSLRDGRGGLRVV